MHLLRREHPARLHERTSKERGARAIGIVTQLLASLGQPVGNVPITPSEMIVYPVGPERSQTPRGYPLGCCRA